MKRCALIVVLSSLVSTAVLGSVPPTTNPSPAVDVQVSQTGQPPISIDVADATLAEVAAALGKATNTRVVAMMRLDADERFTLSAHGKTFWEVFEQLDRQHPITFTFAHPEEHAALKIMQANDRAKSRFRAGDFLVDGRSTSRTRSGSPLLLHWSIVADPRVTISKIDVPLLDVVGARGVKVSAAAKTDAAHAIGSHQLSLQTKLSEPDAPFGAEVSVKATLALDVGQPLTLQVELPGIPVKR